MQLVNNNNNNLETRIEVPIGQATDKDTDSIVGNGITEVVEYTPIKAEEEINKVKETHPSTAPDGYVYQYELDIVADKTCTIQGVNQSIQSIAYGGLTVIDRIEEEEYLYGGRYTKEEVLANIRLMQIYLPEEYNQELFNIMDYATPSNSGIVGRVRLGGGSSALHRKYR